MGRVKYPLTEEAKAAATYLADSWENKRIDQYMEIHYGYENGSVTLESSALIGVSSGFSCTSNGILLELSNFNLVSVNVTPEAYGFRYHVLLLQELRNAVANDFEVSDYFLTFNAIGTIINAAEGSTFHLPSLLSVGEVSGGNVTHSIENTVEIIAELERLVGTNSSESSSEVRTILSRLKTVLGIPSI